jgi:hypothetical protein
MPSSGDDQGPLPSAMNGWLKLTCGRATIGTHMSGTINDAPAVDRRITSNDDKTRGRSGPPFRSVARVFLRDVTRTAVISKRCLVHEFAER